MEKLEVLGLRLDEQASLKITTTDMEKKSRDIVQKSNELLAGKIPVAIFYLSGASCLLI